MLRQRNSRVPYAGGQTQRIFLPAPLSEVPPFTAFNSSGNQAAVGQITSLFVHKVIAQVDPSLDRPALFASVGIDAQAPVDPSLMIQDSNYYELLETLATNDPRALDLPLRVGASMRCDAYGAFGLAWKSATNLRASYERAERYARVLTSTSTYEVKEAPEGVYMILHREGKRRMGLRMSNEATVASIVSISQQVSQSAFQPLAVHFKHPAPASITAHERHFNCKLHFGSKMDALLIAKELLLEPNRLGDNGFSSFLDSHLEGQLSHFDSSTQLEQQVQNEISARLSEGIPRISDVATRLGMSGRTLQRRLSEEGYSFQSLVDESRRQLAERLLRRTQYSLAEIAFLTGFSEQSAFNRAFKRWAGETPRSYRVQALSGSR